MAIPEIYVFDYRGNPKEYWIVQDADLIAACLVNKKTGVVSILTSSDQSYHPHIFEVWLYVVRRAWALAMATAALSRIK